MPGSCVTPPVFAEEMFQSVSRALDRYSWWSVPTLQLGRVMVANSGRVDTNTQQVLYCTILHCTVQYTQQVEVLEHRDIVARAAQVK